VNRGPYTFVDAGAITGEGYKTDKVIGGNCPPVAGHFAFNNMSPDFTTSNFVASTVNLGAFNVGDIISVQFLGAWDDSYVPPPAPGWEINSVQFSPGLENRSADGPVTFSAGASATVGSASVAPSYQWQRDGGSGFVDIAFTRRQHEQSRSHLERGSRAEHQSKRRHCGRLLARACHRVRA
jgi:hypothetical protein